MWRRRFAANVSQMEFPDQGCTCADNNPLGNLILENGEWYINTTERQVGVEQIRSSVAGENRFDWGIVVSERTDLPRVGIIHTDLFL
jgi:hypothetical protein